MQMNVQRRMVANDNTKCNVGSVVCERTPIALVAVNWMALSLSFTREQRKCYPHRASALLHRWDGHVAMVWTPLMILVMRCD